MPSYDLIGRSYDRHRHPDPRIAARIDAALAGAGSIVNVGAGTGSYEPAGRRVVAVEPSRVMIAQRPRGAAPVVCAVAEALPFADGSFDVATAILTVHHWTDFRQGLGEMRRVARRRVVVLTWDRERFHEAFWFVRDYLPEVAHAERGLAALAEITAVLGACAVQAVPIPHDCTDGFFGAYWRRPEAYLDPETRAAISGLARVGEAVVRPAVARLAADLASGAWARRYGHLRASAEIDLGYRLVVA
jgi:SAM-dependent methyltransferase